MYKMLPFFAIVTFGVWMGEFIPQKLPPKLLPLKDFGDPMSYLIFIMKKLYGFSWKVLGCTLNSVELFFFSYGDYCLQALSKKALFTRATGKKCYNWHVDIWG